ncbi:hypothetical protein QBC43DRAFT_333960 [Cladorrhinum sp. PSN259]|nr:hypothetical protein QBC43DRAFT_333960 [Cladorrhinum sp. PSN259]
MLHNMRLDGEKSLYGDGKHSIHGGCHMAVNQSFQISGFTEISRTDEANCLKEDKVVESVHHGELLEGEDSCPQNPPEQVALKPTAPATHGYRGRHLRLALCSDRVGVGVKAVEETIRSARQGCVGPGDGNKNRLLSPEARLRRGKERGETKCLRSWIDDDRRGGDPTKIRWSEWIPGSCHCQYMLRQSAPTTASVVQQRREEAAGSNGRTSSGSVFTEQLMQGGSELNLLRRIYVDGCARRASTAKIADSWEHGEKTGGQPCRMSIRDRAGECNPIGVAQLQQYPDISALPLPTLDPSVL